MANQYVNKVIIGKEVDVLRGDTVRRAKVLGIDDDAALYVQYVDGTTDILRTGEVSTRLVRGEEDEDEENGNEENGENMKNKEEANDEHAV